MHFLRTVDLAAGFMCFASARPGDEGCNLQSLSPGHPFGEAGEPMAGFFGMKHMRRHKLRPARARTIGDLCDLCLDEAVAGVIDEAIDMIDPSDSVLDAAIGAALGATYSLIVRTVADIVDDLAANSPDPLTETARAIALSVHAARAAALELAYSAALSATSHPTGQTQPE
jgi:hypothetical protein